MVRCGLSAKNPTFDPILKGKVGKMKPFEVVKVGQLEVFTNGCGEVFIRNTKTNTTLRVKDSPNGVAISTERFCSLNPIMYSGSLGVELV